MRYLSRVLACIWALSSLASCRVDETHTRCTSNDDCATGDECYLGYCVSDEAAQSESRGAIGEGDSGTRLRRRPTPTLTGRATADAGDRVGMSQAGECVASEEDAGAEQGACCEREVACYEGPKDTRDKGRCRAGMRACQDGRLGACEDSVLPRTETCENQGTDDDCDGELDNVRDRGNECMLDASAQACGRGMLACAPGQKDLQCLPGTPPPELCNAQDDDCDSKIDEAFDLQKDAMNCGKCGTRCTDAQACCMGACVARGGGPDGCPECSATKPCASGGSCCGGACVDVQTSREHCGACGNVCAARQSCCGGTCVDTRSDEKNCGRCGNACTQGTSRSCCASSCVDVSSDRRHCGECGNSCGAVCTCELTDGQPECSGPLGFCL